MKKILLTQGKYALVDDEDFEYLNQWKWCVNAQGYAVRRVYIGTGKNDNRGYFVRMHRAVAHTPKDMITDHINGNKLDNRKFNLRSCFNAENSRNRGEQANNTSGFKGVYYHKKPGLKNRWYARLQVLGKSYNSKLYSTPSEAAIAYNELASRHHGEFARLNNV